MESLELQAVNAGTGANTAIRTHGNEKLQDFLQRLSTVHPNFKFAVDVEQTRHCLSQMSKEDWTARWNLL